MPNNNTLTESAKSTQLSEKTKTFNAENIRLLLFGITAALLIAAGVFILSQPYSWAFIGIGGGIAAWCVYSGLTTNCPGLFSCFQRKEPAEIEEQVKLKQN